MPRLTLLFAATTIFAGVIAVHLWQQLHAERQLTAQLREQIAQPRPQLPEQYATVPAPRIVEQASPPATVAESASRPAVPSAAVQITLPAGNSMSAVRVGELAMRSMFPDLDKALNLSPEEAGELVQLLLRNAPQPEIDALIGQARAQQLQEYQKTLESRRRLNDLRTTLAQSSYPMTDQQLDQLAPVSRAEQLRRDEELRARPRPTDPRAQLDFDEETIKATEASYGRVIAAARSILSPEQLGIMQSSMNNVVSSQRANLQSRRARLAAGGSGAAAAGAATPAGSGGQTPVLIFTTPDGSAQLVRP